jgi:hypothetical protein
MVSLLTCAYTHGKSSVKSSKGDVSQEVWGLWTVGRKLLNFDIKGKWELGNS